MLVDVESRMKKLFLEQINKQLYMVELRNKNESNFLKLFHHSKFEVVCYQEEKEPSFKELEKLQRYLNDFF
jgi:hypothetical protein